MRLRPLRKEPRDKLKGGNKQEGTGYRFPPVYIIQRGGLCFSPELKGEAERPPGNQPGRFSQAFPRG